QSRRRFERPLAGDAIADAEGVRGFEQANAVAHVKIRREVLAEHERGAFTVTDILDADVLDAEFPADVAEQALTTKAECKRCFVDAAFFLAGGLFDGTA